MSIPRSGTTKAGSKGGGDSKEVKRSDVASSSPKLTLPVAVTDALLFTFDSDDGVQPNSGDKATFDRLWKAFLGKVSINPISALEGIEPEEAKAIGYAFSGFDPRKTLSAFFVQARRLGKQTEEAKQDLVEILYAVVMRSPSATRARILGTMKHENKAKMEKLITDYQILGDSPRTPDDITLGRLMATQPIFVAEGLGKFVFARIPGEIPKGFPREFCASSSASLIPKGNYALLLAFLVWTTDANKVINNWAADKDQRAATSRQVAKNLQTTTYISQEVRIQFNKKVGVQQMEKAADDDEKNMTMVFFPYEEVAGISKIKPGGKADQAIIGRLYGHEITISESIKPYLATALATRSLSTLLGHTGMLTTTEAMIRAEKKE